MTCRFDKKTNLFQGESSCSYKGELNAFCRVTFKLSIFSQTPLVNDLLLIRRHNVKLVILLFWSMLTQMVESRNAF